MALQNELENFVSTSISRRDGVELVLYLPLMFGRIHLRLFQARVLFWKKYFLKTMNSIVLTEIRLFRLSIFY